MVFLGFPRGSSIKEPGGQCRRHESLWLGSLGQEDPLWGGHGNPLLCSCLENPMDRGAWQATVLRITKRWTPLKQLSMHARMQMITTNNIKKTLLSFNKYWSKLNPFLLPSLWDESGCQGLEISYTCIKRKEKQLRRLSSCSGRSVLEQLSIFMGKREIDFYLTP